MAIRSLPRKIKYTERDGKTKIVGNISKEVRLTERYKHGDFCRVLQEVKFDNKRETYLRLGYYVKDHGAPNKKYRWGSQTTFMISKKNFLKLIKDSKRKGIL